MPFKKRILSYIRLLLYPFACLYGIVIRIRHFFFNHGLLTSTTFPVPIICVGNLSVGGTGKTPMVLYLIELLEDQYKIATLSRGYKRKTHGFLVADHLAGPDALGDEPYLFYTHFPKITVSVGEDRRAAISALLERESAPEVIIMDDGFQHRKVKPGFSILLTDYSHRFSQDFFLPAGTLRDSRSAATRAQITVVTKCPADLTREDKIKITSELQAFGTNEVFFSQIKYHAPRSLFSVDTLPHLNEYRILLVHGIARPENLKTYIGRFDPDFRELAYPDHHDFTLSDIAHIRQEFQKIQGQPAIILTTEKDAVKLKTLKNALTQLPLYILPIQNIFLFEDKIQFDGRIKQYLQNYK